MALISHIFGKESCRFQSLIRKSILYSVIRNQYMSKKIGGAEGTKFTEEYTEMERKKEAEGCIMTWSLYKEIFNKKYSSSEDKHRQTIYTAAVNRIEKHNFEYSLGIHTYQKGINDFSDMSYREYQQLHGHYKKNNAVNRLQTDKGHARSSYNVPIAAQGKYNSCWAFAAIAALESQILKFSGQMIILSEQQLLDCCPDQCGEKGIACYGYDYIMKNQGVSSEEGYPYEARRKNCRYNKDFKAAAIRGFVIIDIGNEADLMMFLEIIGPLVVDIDGSRRSFEEYSGGIYYDKRCKKKRLSHSVLLVGYGTSIDGHNYWIIKISYGIRWGEKGFARIARGKKNFCGLSTVATYPLIREQFYESGDVTLNCPENIIKR